jgi:hypothetical protein
MTPIEKAARAIRRRGPQALTSVGPKPEWSLSFCRTLARAAIETLRPFIHECVGVTSTSEYPIDKAVDAKIDAMLAEKP